MDKILVEPDDFYVPGHLTCPKCNMLLVKNTLYMKSGTVGANREPDNCMNGCGPMWRVTWKDHAKKLLESLEMHMGEMVRRYEPKT